MAQNIRIKNILNKTKWRDPWFLDDYTINPYSGCSFRCLYCYVKGSKYGLNVEDKLSIKENAVEVLDKQLSNLAKKNRYGIIVLSSSTDPYLQLEKERGLTRELLQIILKYKFPVHILTKSDLILRDLDLLSEIEKNAILPVDLRDRLNRKSFITFSFSILDDSIAKIFEPGATPPSLRISALKEILKEGFFSGVSLMPLLPHISDTGKNLEFMFQTFQEIGIRYIFPASLTLFGGNDPSDHKNLIFKAIENHFPHLLSKYQKFFSKDFRMPNFYQNALYHKTSELCSKYGLQKGILTTEL
ncbi:SPL family radical SAM protein [Leptospira kirschneri]|uniref:SPL family radical SAM protein n=1 Tax=Leptospira kirschneri TaxID=29507 RepID=UPI000306CDC9|nr:radical SAM protein [Leptospira kirschneri]KON78406.1 Radical SAM domain protein [Leptospira kirschneri serovar Mozdok]KPZ78575.1 radical SAM protein [Leptospira kirschneri serovar Mozdok]NDK05616.1 Radical SAM domain protein [Leptospira kirschneri serovar Mozdok]